MIASAPYIYLNPPAALVTATKVLQAKKVQKTVREKVGVPASFTEWLYIASGLGRAQVELVRIILLKFTKQLRVWTNWNEFRTWLSLEQAKPYTIKIAEALWRNYQKCVKRFKDKEARGRTYYYGVG